MSDLMTAEELARRVVDWMWKPNPPLMALLPLCEALLNAREALDQTMPPMGYPGYAAKKRALAAIDALSRREG